MFRVITLAIVLLSMSTAHAQLPMQPQTPAPDYTVAWSRKNGDILLSYVMRIEEVSTRERVSKKDGIEVTIREEVRTPRFLRKYHQRKVADLVVTNAAGEELSEEDVITATKKPTIVLISSDGKKVDPFYLKVVKPETLVIVDKDWVAVQDFRPPEARRKDKARP